ncbi:MAG: 6-phosphofructokinase, partial [Spirochaetota bacterium]
NVVMGRNAGFLTAASTLARQYPADGPHLVYLPENPFDLDSFLGDVDRTFKEHGRALIAISEGINKQGVLNLQPGQKPDYISKWLESHVNIGLPEKYMPRSEAGKPEVDAHGNVALSGSNMMGDILSFVIKSALGIKRVRADTLGYPQRSFPLAVSETDAAEACQVGVDAVIAATDGTFDEGSVAIRRVEEKGEYHIETFITPLQSVQKNTKSFPREWIVEGNGIDERKFTEYVSPLVGELPVIGRFVKTLF